MRAAAEKIHRDQRDSDQGRCRTSHSEPNPGPEGVMHVPTVSVDIEVVRVVGSTSGTIMTAIERPQHCTGRQRRNPGRQESGSPRPQSQVSVLRQLHGHVLGDASTHRHHSTLGSMTTGRHLDAVPAGLDLQLQGCPSDRASIERDPSTDRRGDDLDAGDRCVSLLEPVSDHHRLRTNEIAEFGSPTDHATLRSLHHRIFLADGVQPKRNVVCPVIRRHPNGEPMRHTARRCCAIPTRGRITLRKPCGREPLDQLITVRLEPPP